MYSAIHDDNAVKGKISAVIEDFHALQPVVDRFPTLLGGVQLRRLI